MSPFFRTSPSAACSASVVALLALAPAIAHGQERAVSPGVIYQAGTEVTSPMTGIAFRVPAGFAGEWDPEGGGLVFQADEVLGGVWGWSEGTVEDAAGVVEERLAALGVTLRPRDDVEASSELLRGTFDAFLDDGRQAILSAEVRPGPQGQVLAVAALADAAPAAEAFVEGVSSGVRWSRPAAAAWRPQVEGAVLRWTGGGSDMSSGVTTATGASESEATLAFCGGGYRYAESSESYVSIEGVSASSSSSDEHGGEWYLVADISGAPTLYLFATDGRAFEWSVEETAQGYLIDGYLYRPAGGC